MEKAKWRRSTANCLSPHKLFNPKVLPASQSRPCLWSWSSVGGHYPRKLLLTASSPSAPSSSNTCTYPHCQAWRTESGPPPELLSITRTSRLVIIYLSSLLIFPTPIPAPDTQRLFLKQLLKGSEEQEIKKAALKSKAKCSQFTANSRSIRNERSTLLKLQGKLMGEKRFQLFYKELIDTTFQEHAWFIKKGPPTLQACWAAILQLPCFTLGQRGLVKDQVSIFIFQTLNEVWEDHHHSALTAANFLCINLDINTPPERLLYDKNDPCDSIHT